MKLTTLFLLILFSFSSLLAQKKETIESVKNVRGEFTLHPNSDVSMKQAYEEALNEAKTEALRKVCGEYISIWDEVESSSLYGESFNSFILNQVEGEIVDWDYVVERGRENTANESEILLYVVIDAKVKKGISSDPNFWAEIFGVKGTYFEGENFSFSATAYQDAYLNVFLMEDQTIGYRIYPNHKDLLMLLKAGEKYTLPKNVDIEITKTTNLPTEVNYLVCVFTKEERHFYSETTSRKEIETWIAKIPNDKKYLIFIPFEIRKN